MASGPLLLLTVSNFSSYLFGFTVNHLNIGALMGVVAWFFYLMLLLLLFKEPKSYDSHMTIPLDLKKSNNYSFIPTLLSLTALFIPKMI